MVLLKGKVVLTFESVDESHSNESYSAVLSNNSCNAVYYTVNTIQVTCES